jgi:hypothetical protein
MKGASEMNSKRWTLGVVLAATVSLWGLVEADASPFSSYILSDDLGNMVMGTAAEASEWDTESGASDDSGSSNSGGGNSDSGGNSGGADDGGGASSTGESESGGTENDGHGNNTDGVDSSNKGQGEGGPTGGVDESCPEGGECIDDEIKTNSGKKQ